MTSKLVVPETVQLTQVGADPATVAGHAQVYAKDVGGVAQLFMRAGDGAISQVGSGSGTFSPPERWSQVNIAASQSGIPLSAQVSGNTNTIRMATSGSVVSLSTQLTEAITAGTLTVTVTKNGSPMTLSIVHTSGSGSQATQAVGVDTYMAGDFLGIQLTTDAGFLPITNDIEAWIQCSEAVAGAPGSTIMVIGGTVTGSTDGSVFFANGGTLSQDNSSLYYDVANKRFGLGTSTPSTILDVAGTGNTAAIALRGGASAAVSAASTARLRFNQSTNRLQVSENGGAYADIQTGATFTLDIGDAIGSSTVGSVLFVGTGNVLQQDNANLFWDYTNNRLGVGTNAPNAAIHIENGTTVLTSIGKLRALHASGNSSFDFYDENNVNQFGIGYDNLPNRAQLSMNASQFTIVDNTLGVVTTFFKTGNVNIGPTVGDPGVKLRIEGTTRTTTGLTVDTMTAGSVWFAGASGALTQDNTNFFWDNTNKWHGIGTNTRSDNTGGGGSTQATLEVEKAGAGSFILASAFGTAVNGAIIGLRGRGTRGSPSPVQASDVLALFAGSGYRTTGPGVFNNAADIRMQATALWTNTSSPADIFFRTVPSGSTTLADRLKISEAGTVEVLGGGLISTVTSSGAGFFNTAKFTAGGAATDFATADRELRIQQGANAGGQRYQYLTFNGRWSGNIDSPTLTQGNFDRVSGIEFAAAADSLGPNPNSSINFFVNTGVKSTGSETVVTPTRAMTITYTARVGIGTTDPSEQFHVHKTSAGAVGALIRHATASNAAFLEVQDGDGKRIRLQANAAGGNPYVGVLTNHGLGIVANNAYQATFTTTGTLIVGATAVTKTGLVNEFTKDAANILTISAYGTGVSPELMLLRGRGTGASSAVPQSGDVIGQLAFTGMVSATGFVSGAFIRSMALETWSGTAEGCKIEVWTTQTGTTSRLQRLAIENDGGITLTNSATAAISAASELRLRYNTTGHKLQVSTNAGGYFDVGTYAAAITAGSILFANASNQIAQDNANLFWDDTNNVLGIGTAGPLTNYRVSVTTVTGGSGIQITGANTASYSGLDFYDSGAAFAGAVGYGNSTVAITHVQSKLFHYSAAADWVFANATRNEVTIGMTSGSTFIEIQSGVGAAVSAVNTGRLRYNTFGPALQVSLNAGTYYTIPQIETTLGNGSVIFAAAGRLTQDNANFFWDDTNDRLGIGTATPGVPLDVSSATTVAAIALRSGSTAAVSASSTGRVRYNESSQKFQLSQNAGAYVDVAVMGTAGLNAGDFYFLKEASHQLYVADSTGSNVAGGGLFIKPGDATSGNAAGGDLTLNAGAKVGTGTDGSIYIGNTTAFTLTIGNTASLTIMRGSSTFGLSDSDPGYITVNSGFTTQADSITIDMDLLSSPGQRDSNRFVIVAQAHDGSIHSVFWRQYIDVTSDAGANTYIWEKRVSPAGGFTTVMSLTDAGSLTVTSLSATGLTSGSILFAGAAGLISQDNANFFFDNTNNRLGLGTTSPAVALDIGTGISEAGIQLRTGGSLAVSAASTGRIRYNVTGEVFQISKNASAYEDVASLATAQTFTKSQNVAAVALTDAANIATDASLGNIFTVTLAGNRTLDNPTNLVSGGVYRWIVTQDATGSRTLAYGTMFKWPGGTAPTLTTAANAVDTIEAVYNGTVLLATFALNYS